MKLNMINYNPVLPKNTTYNYITSTATSLFVLSFKAQNIIKDVKNLEYLFDFSNLDEVMVYSEIKLKQLLVNLKLKPLKTFE